MNAALQPSAAPEASTQQVQYLTFVLGAEVFAIDILSIKEILEYNELTAVPMMPDCIRGVINLRGAVVPVVDLLRRFGKSSSSTTKKTCIVIVERKGGERQEDLGVVVDAVNAVVDIAAKDIEPPPALGARVRTEFIRGLGKVNGRFVMLLDVDRVLAIEDINTLDDAVADAHELPI